MNNLIAFPIEQAHSNVVPFTVIEGRKQEKKVKYNLDGSIKKTKNNKVAGVTSEVYAFRTKEEIDAMISVFDGHIANAKGDHHRKVAYRNKMLFIIGINVGIRASDLRALRWSFFYEKSEDGELVFKKFYKLQPQKQKKYGKFVPMFFNPTVQIAIEDFVRKYPIRNLDDYLFLSQKGNGAMEVDTIRNIIKDAAYEAGIKQNIGSHSLRKSFGFWAWHNAQDKNKALVILQQIFSHSSPQTTARYIGILDNEIEDMFWSLNLGLEAIQQKGDFG